MTFLYPTVLLLLLVPLFFLVFTSKLKQNHLEKHFSSQMLSKLSIDNGLINSKIKYFILLLSVVLFIIALARPVQPIANISVPQSKPSVILAVDFSKSMHSTDVYPSRLTLAMKKLKAFVSKAHTSQVGILYYANDAYVFYPISEDMHALSYMLEHTDNNHTFSPNTNLFAALEGAAQLLKNYSNKHVVLFSDGAKNVSRKRELDYVKSKGIIVSALNISAKENTSLRKLSTKSNGHYQNYTWGEEDVENILHFISDLETTSVYKSYDLAQYEEYFMYPLFLALLLLVLLYFPLQKANKSALFIIIYLLQSSLGTTALQAGIFDFWHLYKAKTHMSNKAYNKAIKSYKNVASSPRRHYNLATALYKSMSYSEAIRYYKKALSKDKMLNAQIYHNIANAQVHRNKLDHAKKYYLKSIDNYPYAITMENLNKIQQQLKIQKKNLHKDYEKLYFKPIGKSEFADTTVFSNYAVKLNDFMPEEEERWFAKISKQKSPLFLQKIHTTRRSSDANRTW